MNLVIVTFFNSNYPSLVKSVNPKIKASVARNSIDNGKPCKRENKVLRITIISVTMFSCAWFPYATISMYCQYGFKPEQFVNRHTALLAAMFAKTASIYYPIIYISLNRDCQVFIRKTFKINWLENWLGLSVVFLFLSVLIELHLRQETLCLRIVRYKKKGFWIRYNIHQSMTESRYHNRGKWTIWPKNYQHG